MSRLEKIIIILLILAALSGIAFAYYCKIMQEKIDIAPADISSRAEEASCLIEKSKIININTADKYTLTKLPGIGPQLAQNIIDYRRESGMFLSPDDLLKVKGIGPKKFQSLKDLIAVDEQSK
jgi:competence protein ComEA